MASTQNVFLQILVLTTVMVVTQLAVAAPSNLQLAAAASSEEAKKQREARLIEGAKKEGRVVFWHTGGSAQEWEPLFKKFRERYPFLVVENWRADDQQLYQKITTEAKAGVYNVDLASSEINLIADLKKTGLMKKYDWPNTASWSPQYKDRDGYWITRTINCAAVTYNTNLVVSADAPKNWDDLLDPKWKGSISMGKDSGDWVLMLWAAWGKEKTVNFLKRLAKNNVSPGAGATARIEMLAAGAYKVDLRLNLHQILEYQKKGAPLDWVRTDPMLLKGTPVFIAEHAPHPNAVILFADWFTSFEAQQAYHDVTGRFVPDPKVKSRVSEALKGLRVMLFPAEMAVHGNEADSILRDIVLK
jgi:iron(III) transport system substrate-binding protein